MISLPESGGRSLEGTTWRSQPCVPSAGTPKARGGGSFIRPPVLAGPPAAKPWAACQGDVSHVGIRLDRSQMTLGQSGVSSSSAEAGRGTRVDGASIKESGRRSSRQLGPQGQRGAGWPLGMAAREGGGIGSALVGQLGIDRKGRLCRRGHLSKAWSWEGSSWCTPRPGREEARPLPLVPWIKSGPGGGLGGRGPPEALHTRLLFLLPSYRRRLWAGLLLIPPPLPDLPTPIPIPLCCGHPSHPVYSSAGSLAPHPSFLVNSASVGSPIPDWPVLGLILPMTPPQPATTLATLTPAPFSLRPGGPALSPPLLPPQGCSQVSPSLPAFSPGQGFPPDSTALRQWASLRWGRGTQTALSSPGNVCQPAWESWAPWGGRHQGGCTGPAPSSHCPFCGMPCHSAAEGPWLPCKREGGVTAARKLRPRSTQAGPESVQGPWAVLLELPLLGVCHCSHGIGELATRSLGVRSRPALAGCCGTPPAWPGPGQRCVRAAAPAPAGHVTLDRALITGGLHCKVEAGKRTGVVHRAELSPLIPCGMRDLCFMTND